MGIMMFHRDIWKACQGYDERLIYWGWMEGDLALRLGQKHAVVEFSKFVGYQFYHLEHYSNLTEYKDRNGPATPRKKNKPKFEGLDYSVNDENWGLKKYDLRKNGYKPSCSPTNRSGYIFGILKICLGVFQLCKDFIRAIFLEYFSKSRVFLGKINPLK